LPRICKALGSTPSTAKTTNLASPIPETKSRKKKKKLLSKPFFLFYIKVRNTCVLGGQHPFIIGMLLEYNGVQFVF
jgi:hypothetical protein